MYGNIRVPERMEISATGPAVNELASIELPTKETRCRILLSGQFARQVGRLWRSLGHNEVARRWQPVEVFILETGTA